MLKPIKSNLEEKHHASFKSKSINKLAQASATTNGIEKASKNSQAEVINNNLFSVDLDTGKVSDQMRSGRCWIFANVNVLKEAFIKKTNIDDKDFELSQTYLYFYDKYEKANYFYNNILKTAHLSLGSREVMFLLDSPQEDGGQWDMIVSIVKKYGVLPKSVMPDTANSKNSDQLDTYLNEKLRKDAECLRVMVEEGKSKEDIQTQVNDYLNEVYRILAISLGEPPKRFDFSYRDKDNEYKAYYDLTPLSFYKKFINVPLDDYVSIINAPTNNKPLNKTFTVDMLGNVIGGNPVKYLNVEMETLKSLAIKQLKDGESVWFGCDVGQRFDSKSGLMSLDTYRLNELFDMDFTSTKKHRLEYGTSLLTHAMVLTGVDLKDDKPMKWKVQNSWGEKVGNKGYYVATDSWMDEYTLQVVINKKHMSEELLTIWETDPVVLPAWDPMGSLA